MSYSRPYYGCTVDFIKQRIREQEMYLIELSMREMRGDVSVDRYAELLSSANTVLINFQKELQLR